LYHDKFINGETGLVSVAREALIYTNDHERGNIEREAISMVDMPKLKKKELSFLKSLSTEQLI
jgi:hypothetical protein